MLTILRFSLSRYERANSKKMIQIAYAPATRLHVRLSLGNQTVRCREQNAFVSLGMHF
jgi:hypothetical protein